jgi:hypothetical protein
VSRAPQSTLPSSPAASPAAALAEVVGDVERRLSDFYGFAPTAPAALHVLSSAELGQSLAARDAAASMPEAEGRAGVFVTSPSTADDDLFIGIHFDDSISARLAADGPLVRLSDANLDAYCVVVEEVSHFHLILNRALAARTVSRLELEWQGEIDKLLLAATLLSEQAGHCHLEPLARRLFDEATITAVDAPHYWEATRLAARFWRSATRQTSRVTSELRDTLRASYYADWERKLKSA